MHAWSNLSENLKQTPAVSSLATIVTGLAETYGTEGVNLINHFSNNLSWSNIPDYQKNWPKENWTSDTFWYAGLDFDAKTSFAWGFTEGFEEGVKLAQTTNFNPYWDVYGYFSTYFDFHIPYAMIGFNFYVSPTQAHLFEFGLSLPKHNSHYPVCWGAKAF